jgi:aspartate 1-decarboxylase
LIIYAYEERDRQEVIAQGHQARVLIADAHNRCATFLHQSLEVQGGRWQFHDGSDRRELVSQP